MTTSRRENTGSLWAGLVVLSLLLVGCAPDTAPAAPPSSSSSSSPAPSRSPLASPTAPTDPPAVPDIPTADAELAAPAVVVSPVRLVIPQLGIDMDIEAMGLDADGAMALPADAATAGWYRFGPGVHAPAGATVVAAHIDSWHDGIGPFSRLDDLARGGEIELAGSDGTSASYVVSEVRAVGKIDAPMAEVFDRGGEPRLTLVTCGGVFDSSTGHYVDNIIVTATPVRE